MFKVIFDKLLSRSALPLPACHRVPFAWHVWMLQRLRTQLALSICKAAQALALRPIKPGHSFCETSTQKHRLLSASFIGLPRGPKNGLKKPGGSQVMEVVATSFHPVKVYPEPPKQNPKHLLKMDTFWVIKCASCKQWAPVGFLECSFCYFSSWRPDLWAIPCHPYTVLHPIHQISPKESVSMKFAIIAKGSVSKHQSSLPLHG